MNEEKSPEENGKSNCTATESNPSITDNQTFPEVDNEIDDIIQKTDLDLLTNVNDESESEDEIDGKSSIQPLKKRRRMMEVPYPTGQPCIPTQIVDQ